jgi:hypothetical protein
MADAEKNPDNFTVTDRRAFDSSGERKSDTPEVQGKPSGSPGTSPDGARALPPADFATLVLSLGTSAVMYLGESEGPGGKKPTRNLPMAKHAIDLLTVLEEKTKGNLSSEEQQILESLLFDLRLRYVEGLKASPSAG